MAKIRKIYDQTIKPDGTKTTIYPITSTRAVYTPEGETLDSYLKDGYFHGADLRGYKTVSSTAGLPTAENQFGWLIGEDIYVWVGVGGNALDGRYQNCGHFRTPYIPDEEDITVDEENYLKFRDRDSEHGMGYVILRRGIPLSSQIVSPNTIYEIRYDFDLDNESVTIPNDCVLDFKGGGLSNGSVVFDGTLLVGAPKFDCSFSGTLSNSGLEIVWFVSPNDSWDDVSDSTEKIQMAFNCGASKIAFPAGVYSFHDIQIENDIEIEGNGTIIKPVEVENDVYDFMLLNNVFHANGIDNIYIHGIHFKSVTTGNPPTSPQPGRDVYGNPLIWCENVQKAIIEDCFFDSIENTRRIGPAYTEGTRVGSVVSMNTVYDVTIRGCELNNCRGDEQIWIYPKTGTYLPEDIYKFHAVFEGNYIHDQTLCNNSSALMIAAGYAEVNNNKVDNYNYVGSLFNLHVKNLVLKDNVVKNSFCTTVFDMSEGGYYYTDSVMMENNYVEAVNSIMLQAQTKNVIIRDNKFKGLMLYVSGNWRVNMYNASTGRWSTPGSPLWYTNYEDEYGTGEHPVLPTDLLTIIEDNEIDCTNFDDSKPCTGCTLDYSSYDTGIIVGPCKSDDHFEGQGTSGGIVIKPYEAKAMDIQILRNHFVFPEVYVSPITNYNGTVPAPIKLSNVESINVRDNVFHGSSLTYNSSTRRGFVHVNRWPTFLQTLVNRGYTPAYYQESPYYYEDYHIDNNTFYSEYSSAAILLTYKEVTADFTPVHNLTPQCINNVSITGNTYKNPGNKYDIQLNVQGQYMFENYSGQFGLNPGGYIYRQANPNSLPTYDYVYQLGKLRRFCNYYDRIRQLSFYTGIDTSVEKYSLQDLENGATITVGDQVLFPNDKVYKVLRTTTYDNSQSLPENYDSLDRFFYQDAWWILLSVKYDLTYNSKLFAASTAARPVDPPKGYLYFDTSLESGSGKPIWWNGTAWVDATGTEV